MSTDRHNGVKRGAVSLTLCGASLLGTVALMSACPGSLENKQQFLDACPDVKSKILQQRCATSNCHDSDEPAGSVDLTPNAGLAARLVDVNGVSCTGKLVDSENPEESLVYTKVLSSNDCGARMPVTGEKLSPKEEECLLEFLESL